MSPKSISDRETMMRMSVLSLVPSPEICFYQKLYFLKQIKIKCSDNLPAIESWSFSAKKSTFDLTTLAVNDSWKNYNNKKKSVNWIQEVSEWFIVVVTMIIYQLPKSPFQHFPRIRV